MKKMMKKLTLSKYLTTALKWLTPFALLEILICVLHFSGIAEATLFAMINVIYGCGYREG